ncbi:MAG: sigma-70 family RNA polymerase sigma factor [Acidobacteria bacterium]|nr:MAG: sigma-70 family RNA polymerase sigma factor [Acidobacteriota bacterium]REK07651.1 MAG: sigma-70 family RNA polymerase sigma factor [Acidobacteriota bacterium]
MEPSCTIAGPALVDPCRTIRVAAPEARPGPCRWLLATVRRWLVALLAVRPGASFAAAADRHDARVSEGDSGLSDEALIDRARSTGDPERREQILGILYGRYLEQVVRWALRLVGGDEQEAHDLAQDTFVRAHGAIDGFRGDSKFSTWLYTIVRRTAINRGLARARRAAEPLDEAQVDGLEAATPEGAQGAGSQAEQTVVDEVHLRRRRRQLVRLIDSELDAQERRVFALHYGEGLTLVAITDLLDLGNRSGAKAILVRGQRKLRRALAEG